MNFTAWPVCNGFAWTPAYISIDDAKTTFMELTHCNWNS